MVVRDVRGGCHGGKGQLGSIVLKDIIRYDFWNAAWDA